MSIKDIKLIKGMVKEEVNGLIGEWLTLEDEVYVNAKHKHNWKCKCGNVFERTWNSLKGNKFFNCGCIGYNQQEERYKYEVEKTGEYEYIRSYRKGDTLPNGRVVKCSPYIQIKHKYCGSIYYVDNNSFINGGKRCGKCCQKYENSFAYHIEVELNEPLEKYWDFEKNTVNPYHIKRSSGKKIWIKCQEKRYHGSYEIGCNKFTLGRRCSYCDNKKVHLLDSFGYRNFDKVQSWHPDNEISPFKVAPNSGKKYKFICPDCGHEWETSLYNTSNGTWCPMCKSSKGEKEISKLLKLKNIWFIKNEEYFGDLKGLGGKPLRPDFILPDHKIWIEYDGEFHYKKMYDDDNYEILKEHDKRKDKYAKEYGWKIIRIPYYDFDNIENILKNELNI